MSVSQHDWSLHRKGQIDQERHKEKIREAIKKNLGEIVSEENIILSDGKKTVRVPIRSLDEYRFRYDPGRQQHGGQGNGKSKVGDVVAQEPRQGKGKKGDAGKEAGYDYYEAEVTMEELAAMIFEDLELPNLEQKRQQELQTDAVRFTDVRKKGPMTNLDKKRTIMENMKRNAAKGEAKFGDIKSEDLRFKVWEPTIKYQSNAVVIAMMDVSGCHTAGHAVEMADGSYKDVSEIVEGDQVACLNLETLEKTTSTVVETFSKIAAETLSIETEDAILRATPEHRYFVYDEENHRVIEKHADELHIGDKLMLINSWGSTSQSSAGTLTQKRAYQLGVLLADEQSASAALTDELVRDYPLLREPAQNRSIDASLYREKPEVRAALLRGLFETRGIVTDQTIVFEAASQRLVRQVKHLLSYWGIRAQVKSVECLEQAGEREEKKVADRLSIHGSDVLLFAEHIGFESPDKRTRTKVLSESQMADIHVRPNISILEENWSKHFAGLSSSEQGQLSPLATSATATLEEQESINAQCRVLVSHVRSIGRIAEPVQVYDFGVAEHHNYIVDGMLSHNSMGEFEKYIARSFYFWMVRFLRTKYNNVQIVFISHHTEAKEVTEEEFFHKGESGGTQVSSAYELALQIIKDRYNPNDWNVYPFHFSDGDNLPWDNDRCVQLVTKLMELCNIFGYGEIREGHYRSPSTLMSAYNKVTDKKFISVTISDKKEVYPALRKFFAQRGDTVPSR